MRKNFAKGLLPFLPFWPRMRALYESAKKKSILSQGSGKSPAHPGGDALWYRRPELNWYSLKFLLFLPVTDFLSLEQELTKPFLLAKNAVPKKVTAIATTIKDSLQGERA